MKRLKSKTEDKPIRINKFLSDAGVCSRREADRLIDDARISINGKVAVLGDKVTYDDVILFDDMPVTREEEQIILAFNKPVGIECTADLSNPDNIVDFVNYEKRVYPIGRLDKNSEGLILLTNDGSIVNGILKSSNYHEKEYMVVVDKPVTGEFLEAMSSGVKIFDEVTTRPCEVRKTGDFEFHIVLTQGLNRQIRRMCKALGSNVVKLKRIRIMNVELSDIPIGEYRDLTDAEVETLMKQIGNGNE